MAKYRYVVNYPKRTVVAMTTFEGRPVRGIAKCSEDDTFDEATGRALAAARVSLKIAEKNLKFIEKLSADAKKTLEFWANKTDEYVDRELAAAERYKNCLLTLAEMESKLK